MGDRLTFDSHLLINTLALAARLPTMHGFRASVESGGLMSYGPNFRDLSRRAADYVDKILRGTKPADLAVQQPTKFELLINLKTAKALGLDMPARLLVLADELIECIRKIGSGSLMTSDMGCSPGIVIKSGRCDR